MNYHTIDSITLMKAIELLDGYHWLLSSTQSNPVNPDLPLVLSSLRNIALAAPKQPETNKFQDRQFDEL